MPGRRTMAGGHRPCMLDCSIIWAFMRTSWKLRAAVRNSSAAVTSAGIQMHSVLSVNHLHQHQGPPKQELPPEISRVLSAVKPDRNPFFGCWI